MSAEGGSSAVRGEAETGAAARRTAFLLVCIAYLATTTGESLLAPIYPVVAPDLHLDLGDAGVAFAVLAFSIAGANLASGVLLRHWSANRVICIALAATACGSVVGATSTGSWQFYASQVLLGAGAGLLYPAAIMSIGAFAGPQRRGVAMATFGVFFSGGLTLAAGLAALGTRVDWRLSFLLGAVLAIVAAVGVWPITDAPKSAPGGRLFSGLGQVLGVPTVVGVVGGISQYATVSFFPVFAVTVWDISDAAAAALLAAGRVLSIPAKLVSGGLADRRGAVDAARLTGVALAVVGAAWALSPSVPVAAAGGVAFTAGVSGLFPLANLLAFERVGQRGGALGAFRSVQLAAGAIAGFVVGTSADAFGLRPTVAVVAVLPALLVGLHARDSVGPSHSVSVTR